MTARWDDPPWRLVVAGAVLSVVQPRIRAVMWIRTGMWLWRRRLRIPAYWCKARAVRAAGVEVHPAAQIGPGLNLVHSVGVVIGHEVTAGNDLVLYQGVTLGHGSAGGGQPTIGDGVRIFAGAVVLGPVTVGDGAKIGANATVLGDVPPGTSVVGVWKRVVGE